jgi:hypothetical protein
MCRSSPKNASSPPGPGGLVSILFLVGAWFVAARFGLIVTLVAVAIWWVGLHPRVICVGCLRDMRPAPLALFLQGLPGSAVAAADFEARHWVVNDLAVAVLWFAALAAPDRACSAWMCSGRARDA